MESQDQHRHVAGVHAKVVAQAADTVSQNMVAIGVLVLDVRRLYGAVVQLQPLVRNNRSVSQGSSQAIRPLPRVPPRTLERADDGFARDNVCALCA